MRSTLCCSVLQIYTIHCSIIGALTSTAGYRDFTRVYAALCIHKTIIKHIIISGFEAETRCTAAARARRDDFFYDARLYFIIYREKAAAANIGLPNSNI